MKTFITTQHDSNGGDNVLNHFTSEKGESTETMYININGDFIPIYKIELKSVFSELQIVSIYDMDDTLIAKTIYAKLSNGLEQLVSGIKVESCYTSVRTINKNKEGDEANENQ